MEDRPPGLSGQTAVAAVKDRQRQAGSPSAMTGGTPVLRLGVEEHAVFRSSGRWIEESGWL